MLTTLATIVLVSFPAQPAAPQHTTNPEWDDAWLYAMTPELFASGLSEHSTELGEVCAQLIKSATGSQYFNGVMQNEVLGQTLWEVFLPE